MQARLVQTFENGRLILVVVRPESKIAAQYSLVTEIRRFEIDVTTGEAVVEISAKLISESAGRIVAASIFTASVPGGAQSGAQASTALDDALGQVMTEIAQWAPRHV